MTSFPIASLVYHAHEPQPLQTLWQAIATMQQQGLHVAGLLNPLDEQGNKLRHLVHSLTDKQEFRIMYDDVDPQSTSCALNAQGLAAASIVIRQALQNKPDVLVFNKFGVAESEGRGLYQEFVDAFLAGIPIISLVQDKYLPNWQAFTADNGIILGNSVDEIVNWALGLCR